MAAFGVFAVSAGVSVRADGSTRWSALVTGLAATVLAGRFLLSYVWPPRRGSEPDGWSAYAVDSGQRQ